MSHTHTPGTPPPGALWHLLALSSLRSTTPSTPGIPPFFPFPLSSPTGPSTHTFITLPSSPSFLPVAICFAVSVLHFFSRLCFSLCDYSTIQGANLDAGDNFSVLSLVLPDFTMYARDMYAIV